MLRRGSCRQAGSLVLEASLNIRDLETQYNLRLPRDEGFETLAGFVLAQLQRIPTRVIAFFFSSAATRWWRWKAVAWSVRVENRPGPQGEEPAAHATAAGLKSAPGRTARYV